MTAREKHRPPPLWFWLLPLLAVLLRGLPYLTAVATPDRQGSFYARVGYLPDDFFSYAAFIRQAAEHGRCFLLDPYTTELHQPRFILILHGLLGGVARLTGAEPMLVLELSRAPLIFLFFFTLWRFTGVVHEDRRVRLWAAALVGFSGGVEGFLQPYTHLAPPFVAQRFREGAWHLYGWNTFQSFFNPLWIAGLTLTLWMLMMAMDVRKPWRWRQGPLLGCGLILQFYTHPYSALVTLAVLTCWPLASWTLQAPVPWKRLSQIAAWLAPALALLAAVNLWQTRDPIYRLASSNVMGPLQLAVFWYPLTLGVVGIMALRGLSLWIGQRHPFLPQMAAWIGAVILLHTSPVVNGYHFVFHLHLPLALLAAPAVAAAWEQQRPVSGGTWNWKRVGLAFVLFASCLLTTAESVGDIARRNRLPIEYRELLRVLSEYPAGSVLAPPDLSNLVPAYTAHHVWVGHWFLTPDYRGRIARYSAAISPDADPEALLQLAQQAQADYVIAPMAVCDLLRQRIGIPIGAVFGTWELLSLKQPGRPDVRRVSSAARR